MDGHLIQVRLRVVLMIRDFVFKCNRSHVVFIASYDVSVARKQSASLLNLLAIITDNYGLIMVLEVKDALKIELKC